MKKIVYVLIGSLVGPSLVFGQQDSALLQTQELLKDSQKRETLFKTDSNAKETDKKLNQMTGSIDISQEIYALSADIFKILYEQSGGDAQKMQTILVEGVKNPAKFGQSFTPEQQAKLKEIALKIESQNKGRP